jgi:hypothetical protein
LASDDGRAVFLTERGSSPVEYDEQEAAEQVGIKEAASASADRRGTRPSASMVPLATCTAALARTTSTSSSGSGTTLRMAARVSAASSGRLPGARRASIPSMT